MYDSRGETYARRQCGGQTVVLCILVGAFLIGIWRLVITGITRSTWNYRCASSSPSLEKYSFVHMQLERCVARLNRAVCVMWRRHLLPRHLCCTKNRAHSLHHRRARLAMKVHSRPYHTHTQTHISTPVGSPPVFLHCYSAFLVCCKLVSVFI
jgi:hypothetical protein